MTFKERYAKAKEVDRQIADVQRRMNVRRAVIPTPSRVLEQELEELQKVRQTLPPKTDEHWNSPDLGKNVAFWAGGELKDAIATTVVYNKVDSSIKQANVVITHEGGLIASNAYIRGTIMATDGVFSGTIYANEGRFSGKVSIANGKILLDTDGSGHLADGSISWDKEGNLSFESNKDGNRIVIDPTERCFKMLDSQDREISRLEFDTGTYQGEEWVIPSFTLNRYSGGRKTAYTTFNGQSMSLYGIGADNQMAGFFSVDAINKTMWLNYNELNRLGEPHPHNIYLDGETLKVKKA